MSSEIPAFQKHSEIAQAFADDKLDLAKTLCQIHDMDYDKMFKFHQWRIPSELAKRAEQNRLPPSTP